MPVPHLHSSQAVAVGEGPRASKKLDYIRREGEYSYKPDSGNIVFWEGNIPDQFNDIDDFLLHAEFHERKNGTIYREIEFALPRELDPQQRIELANEIVQRFTDRQVDNGGPKILTPFAAAIHNLEGGNPHVHLIRAERHITPEAHHSPKDKAGFFKRRNKKSPEKGGLIKLENTSKFRKEALKWERQEFEFITNNHLRAIGHDGDLDMRSYKDQGKNLIPQIHESPKERAVHKRTGKKSERMKFNDLVRERNELLRDYEAFKENANVWIDHDGPEAIDSIRRHFDIFLDSAPDEMKKELQSDFKANYGHFPKTTPKKGGDFEM